MPLLRLSTNQQLATTEGRADFLRRASGWVADHLDKPERYCMVTLETGVSLLFAGSDEPAAFAELASLGLPRDDTGRLSVALCDLINEGLGVAPERIYIHFRDVERPMWGTNRTTFG
ncbi:phenylpyruvate tautomerase MIF-related protein [Thiohalorhabdus sp.]|uniref:phenylpyruvate tautomerase MIF-related protein n=1 Tax=Thiohalorhabdus sp. TaxID=3094134 RepID=UPI002FC2793D